MASEKLSRVPNQNIFRELLIPGFFKTEDGFGGDQKANPRRLIDKRIKINARSKMPIYLPPFASPSSCNWFSGVGQIFR